MKKSKIHKCLKKINLFFTLLIICHSHKVNSTLLTSKIIGGTKSSATYVVPVKVRAVHKGSASLLSDMHGITAIKVAEECSKDLDCAYVEVSEDQSFIEEIIYYNEDYDRTLKNPDDNFAIIKLIFPVQFTKELSKIELSLDDIFGDSYLFVCGWGCSEIDSIYLTVNLMELEVMRHSDVICRNLVQVPMHNTQMCASGVSEEDYANPYHGDYGDPLVIRREGENDRLVGIVVFYHSDLKIPAIYTKVKGYYNFINQTIFSQPQYIARNEPKNYLRTESCGSSH